MKLTVLLLILSSTIITYSQSYFQQNVDYIIDVTLDDKNNTLSAYEEFVYTEVR